MTSEKRKNENQMKDAKLKAQAVIKDKKRNTNNI